MNALIETAGPNNALQRLLFRVLTDSPDVMVLIDGVFDEVPKEAFGLRSGYVSFGPVDVVELRAEGLAGGDYNFQIDCWSRRVGMTHCKDIADAVKYALHDQEFSLQGNALVELSITGRRTLLDPDGKTKHGVVTGVALIDERRGASLAKMGN